MNMKGVGDMEVEMKVEKINMIDFSKKELERAGMFDKDSDYEGMIGRAVMELIEVFSKQKHSGFSAMSTIEVFSRVAKFKKLSP